MTPEQIDEIKRNVYASLENAKQAEALNNPRGPEFGSSYDRLWSGFVRGLRIGTDELMPIVDSLQRQLAEAQAERDALQARIDGALAILGEESGNPFGSQYYNEEIEFYEGMRESLQRLLSGKSDRYLKAFEILTGEGE